MQIIDTGEKAKTWHKVAAILILTNCLALIPSMAYIPLIPMIKAAITMSFTQLGLFSGLAGVLAIVCAVPAGIAIKRFGGRKVFFAGMVVMIMGLLVLSFSETFAGALSGRGIWQVGLRFLIPALTATLVVSVPDNNRSTVMGIGIAVSYIGTIIAQNFGAWIAQVSDWQVTIRFFAAIVSVGGAVFFMFYRGKPASEAEAALKGGGKASLKSDKAKHRSVYFTPSVWMLCLLVIFACEEGLVDSFAVIQMGELWGTDAVQFAWILSFGMILAIFVNLGAGWCGDRFGNWNMLIVTGLLNSMVGVFLLVGQFNMKSIYITGILIAKALQLTTTLFVNSLAPTFLGGRDVGPIIAIIFLGSGLGQYFGPQVIGILKDTTGAYTIGWIYIAACGVMSVLISFGFKIYFERKES